MDIAVINQLPFEALSAKRVLVRIDVEQGELPAESFAEWRLRNELHTLKYLLRADARIVLAAQSGIQGGQREEGVLNPLAEQLSAALHRDVIKLPEAIGEGVQRTLAGIDADKIVLLENLALYPGEEQNDPEFARQLAELADIFCNDAFSIANRVLASTVGVTRFLPVSVAGLEMARELTIAEGIAGSTESPFLAVIAGARFEEKLPVLARFLPKVTHLFIGGALCFPFLKAKGLPSGAVTVDDELVPLADRLLSERDDVLLPSDFMVVDADEWLLFVQRGRTGPVPTASPVLVPDVLASHRPVDIGPDTVRRLGVLIEQARTFVWNGPLGIWEVPPFHTGTREVAAHLARHIAGGFRGILCGDDLVRAVRSFDIPLAPLHDMTSGGQAMLELLAGRPLPAVAALSLESDLVFSGHRRPRRVLLPVDGSIASLKAVQKTAGLFDVNGAEIHLVFVQEPSSLLFADGWLKRRRQRPDEVKRHIEAERVFALCNALLARHGAISHRQTILEGDRSESILRYADEIGADFLALGPDSDERPVRWLSGDPLRRIVRTANCPVLVVRDREAEGVTAT
jgi:phosphoglycerate kinase